MSRVFRVGDRVRRIRSEWGGMHVDDIGTVHSTGEDSSLIRVTEYGTSMHESRNFELVEDRPVRATRFRIGDKVKCISINHEYMNPPNIGMTCVVQSIDPSSDMMVVSIDSVDNAFYIDDFELVLPLSTLIKRANMGLKAMHELQTEHPDKVQVKFESDSETEMPGISYCYDNEDIEDRPRIVEKE